MMTWTSVHERKADDPEELRERTPQAIRETFDKAGVVFISEDGGGPGVRSQKRRRSK
jgi:hypothetical protein